MTPNGLSEDCGYLYDHDLEPGTHQCRRCGAHIWPTP